MQHFAGLRFLSLEAVSVLQLFIVAVEPMLLLNV